MKRMKIWLAAMSMSFAFLIPSATTAGAGLSSSFVIAELGAQPTNLQLIAASSFTSPMGCTNTMYVRLPTSAANYDVIASTLVTAFATGKSVTVFVYGCDSENVSLIVAAYVAR